MSSLACLLYLGTIAACSLLCVYVFYAEHRRAKGVPCKKTALPAGNSLLLPPGPPGLPIIGNLRDLPRRDEAAAYFEMSKKYGDIVHLNVLGRHIVVVNSYAAAVDLFEKRSANYSDRGTSAMVELMGWDWSFGHMRYGFQFSGENWKSHRKMFHRQFQASSVSNYHAMQLQEARSLLRGLLHSPEDWLDHLRHHASATIMRVTYGISIDRENDKAYVDVAEKALEGMAKAANPGAFLVDIFPWLRHIPEWVPGANFQKKAREWKEAVMAMRDRPFAAVQLALDQGGGAPPCFVTHAMDDFDPKENFAVQIDTLRNCAGMAYAASTESIVSALSSFFLAMILYPNVQKTAREELDRVVGKDRLPDFRDSLPYISCIVKELFRWNPVAPLGLPHMVTDDDVYCGYLIPSGAAIMGNTWAILHDDKIFPNPDQFDPDRFSHGRTSPEAINALGVAFGYGRRVCPGHHMAEAQLWIVVGSILSVFEIGAAKGENEKVSEVKAAFSSGFISHPLRFPCAITSRVHSDHTGSLVDQSVEYCFAS